MMLQLIIAIHLVTTPTAHIGRACAGGAEIAAAGQEGRQGLQQGAAGEVSRPRSATVPWTSAAGKP